MSDAGAQLRSASSGLSPHGVRLSPVFNSAVGATSSMLTVHVNLSCWRDVALFSQSHGQPTESLPRRIRQCTCSGPRESHNNVNKFGKEKLCAHTCLRRKFGGCKVVLQTPPISEISGSGLCEFCPQAELCRAMHKRIFLPQDRGPRIRFGAQDIECHQKSQSSC